MCDLCKEMVEFESDTVNHVCIDMEKAYEIGTKEELMNSPQVIHSVRLEPLKLKAIPDEK